MDEERELPERCAAHHVDLIRGDALECGLQPAAIRAARVHDYAEMAAGTVEFECIDLAGFNRGVHERVVTESRERIGIVQRRKFHGDTPSGGHVIESDFSRLGATSGNI